jgi:hypothetical protein
MIFIFPVSAYAVAADYNGDAKSDVLSLYDYDNSAALWAFQSGTGNSLAPELVWAGNPGDCDAARCKVVSGDFDADGNGDVALFYDYGGGMTRVWVLNSNGTTMTPSLVWSSGTGNCDATKCKIVSGDYNGDGKTDIAILYDYGHSTSRVWVLTSNGSTMTSSLAWSSGAGNCDAAKCKIVSGDYDGDGKSDIAVLYDYGTGMTRAWILKSSGTTFSASLAWASGIGNCDLNKSKVVSGDYDGDGKSDVALLYDYNGGMTRVWVLTSNGTTMALSLAWVSGAGNCDAARCKVVSGDYDADGKSDIAILYDYGNSTSRIWELISAGSTFMTPKLSWYSGPGNWDWIRTKLADAGSGSSPSEPGDYYIGASVLGRPIIATKIGSGTRRYLFIGAHHGDEAQGGRVLELFRDYLLAHPEAVPNDAEVWIVPYLNPDGVAAATRWNAHGVNLNRNYWTNDWGLYDVTSLTPIEMSAAGLMTDMSMVATGTPFTFNYPGPAPFSEPETAAVAGLCATVPFRAMITLHDMEGRVYWGQTGTDLAYLYGRLAGLPVVGPLSISGDATRWFGQTTGGPSVTVEMTYQQVNESPVAAFGEYLPAFLATLNY